MKTVNKVFEYKDEKFNIAIRVNLESTYIKRTFPIRVTGITMEGYSITMDVYEYELYTRLTEVEKIIREEVDNYKNKNQDILTKLENLGFN